MYFILRYHILQTTIFIVLSSRFINTTCIYFELFQNMFLLFTKYTYHCMILFMVSKPPFYMVILNQIKFRNYNTHVSFSHDITHYYGLVNLLATHVKHWRNINVLININKYFIFYDKWFIYDILLSNLILRRRLTKSISIYTTWSLKDQTIVYQWYISLYFKR